MCAGNELWFSMIYMLHFGEGPSGRKENNCYDYFIYLYVNSTSISRLFSGSLAYYSLCRNTNNGIKTNN